MGVKLRAENWNNFGELGLERKRKGKRGGLLRVSSKLRRLREWVAIKFSIKVLKKKKSLKDFIRINSYTV